MQICFHGTTKKNAEKILSSGFNIGTWFALHLEDALEFGGEYVFQVEFAEDRFSNDVDWQFHLRKRISPERIRRLDQYFREQINEP